MKSLLTLSLFFFLFAANTSFAQTVYITDSGKKYHAKNCSVAKTGKRGIKLEEAKKQGYVPCKVCKIEDILAEEEKEKKAKSSKKKN